MEDHSPNWIEAELRQLDAAGLRRTLKTQAGPQGAIIEVAGRGLINFGSNDYLGLAGDSRLADAAVVAADKEGWGSGASPLVTGRSTSHQRLEEHLAQFEGTEAALLFSTGFAANMGTIASLAGRGDLILSDERNHASIIDGCRLSRAEVFIYPHRDTDAVAVRLKAANGFRRRLIVTDSLFSMDGDCAPLPALAGLAERYDTMLLVDEAHASGVFGERGRGLCEQFGVEESVTARVGTLSKGLGSLGGFVVGSQQLIDYLVNRARPYVYSTAMPAAVAAAAIASLDIVRDEPHRRRELLRRAGQLRTTLRENGWQVGEGPGPIIPVIIGDPDETMELSARLADAGFFVPGIRPPTVPDGRSLLRISLSYLHSEEMIAGLIAVLANPQ